MVHRQAITKSLHVALEASCDEASALQVRGRSIQRRRRRTRHHEGLAWLRFRLGHKVASAAPITALLVRGCTLDFQTPVPQTL